MGCKISKLINSLRPGAGGGQQSKRNADDTVQKTYSWEKRAEINIKDFTFDGNKDEVIGRLPGSVNGQQFIIQNCENCDIYIFDHCAAVNIDDCSNCRILIGAVKTSIFIRDCKDCTIITACQQFRTRDCKKLNAFLCCVTQPIIESTTDVKFGCLQLSYPQFRSHLIAAGLGPYNNHWNNIHDFTPVPGENNYAFVSQSEQIANYLPLPSEDPFKSIPITFDSDESDIPYTLGNKLRPTGTGCLLAIFHSSSQLDITRRILHSLKNVPVVQTTEIKLSSDQAKKIFTSDKYSERVKDGPVIIIEFLTNDMTNLRKKVINVVDDKLYMIHMSRDADVAVQEIDGLNNLVEMQMSV